MTLEQWAYIAQIAAAVAVVASLLYVARQLRQNLALMRVNASSERVQRDFDLSQPLIENREVAEIWVKGGDDFASLDRADQTRLLFFERRAIVHWHNMFRLHQEGLLSELDWRELQWLIQNLRQRQALRTTWELFRESFDASFQSFMEEQLATAEASGQRDSSQRT